MFIIAKKIFPVLVVSAALIFCIVQDAAGGWGGGSSKGSVRSPQAKKAQTSQKYIPQESFFDQTDKEMRARQEAKMKSKKADAEAEKLAADKSQNPEKVLESARKTAEQYRQYATKLEAAIPEHPEWSMEKVQGFQEMIGLFKSMAEQQEKIIQSKQKGDTVAVDAAKEKHKELEAQCKVISEKIRNMKLVNTEEKSPDKGYSQPWIPHFPIYKKKDFFCFS